jgi:hypothetical protein
MKYTFFLLNLLFSRTALIFNLLFILILCVRLPFFIMYRTILKYQVCIMLAMNDTYAHVYGWGSDVQCHFQQYFSYIVAVSFIGE